jgi:FKBP-type peptidyl-prolyl cis-trans isomerase
MDFCMKKVWVLLCVGVLFLFGCQEKGAAGDNDSGYALDKDASYALGMNVGLSLKRDNLSPDLASFAQGIEDVLEGKKPRLAEEEAQAKLQEAFSAIMEKQREATEEQGKKLQQDEITFLAENSKKAGIIITSSGLQYEVITEGAGAKPGPDDTVRVNYEGTFTDGTVFDSSYERGEPAEFPLSGVIPGWTEGIQLMSEGANYRFYIPSDLAYGPQGYSSIPPYSPLIFKVELIAVVK